MLIIICSRITKLVRYLVSILHKLYILQAIWGGSLIVCVNMTFCEINKKLTKHCVHIQSTSRLRRSHSIIVTYSFLVLGRSDF